jgi:hypothetical protein
MHDGGGGGGGFTGGSGLSGDHHSGHTAGGHSGSGHSGGGHSGGRHGSSGAGGFDPSGQRTPYRDSLDPLGPMSMPKIVGRAADRARRGQQGPSVIAARVFVISVFAIIIVFAILFIVHGN